MKRSLAYAMGALAACVAAAQIPASVDDLMKNVRTLRKAPPEFARPAFSRGQACT